MVKKGLFFTLIYLTFSYAFGFSQNKDRISQTRKQNHYTVNLEGTLATYASPPLLPDGRVNEHRLISELKDLHANTYNWLICRRDSCNLNELKHFLPLARQSGIKVWVTLVPPSEPPPSEPFRLDYDQWAAELAVLSKKEPNLVAWNIDDFTHNLKFFSPGYVTEFLTRAYAINPKLAFVPTCYFKGITPSFVKDYGGLLSGILFPYRAGSVGPNLKDPSLVADEIKRLRSQLGQKFPIFIDVYASAHSTLGKTTPEYVKIVVKSSMNLADGVLIYRNQDPVKEKEKYRIIKNIFKQGFAVKK